MYWGHAPTRWDIQFLSAFFLQEMVHGRFASLASLFFFFLWFSLHGLLSDLPNWYGLSWFSPWNSPTKNDPPLDPAGLRAKEAQETASEGHRSGLVREWANSPNSKFPYQIIIIHGGFHKWGYPKMDGLKGNIPLKWMMIAGYPHIRKPSYMSYSFIAVVGYPSFQQRHVRLSDCFIWIFQGLMSNGCTCTLLPIPYLLLLLRSLQVFFKMSVSLNLFL